MCTRGRLCTLPVLCTCAQHVSCRYLQLRQWPRLQSSSSGMYILYVRGLFAVKLCVVCAVSGARVFHGRGSRSRTSV